jgi:hypothetical protein
VLLPSGRAATRAGFDSEGVAGWADGIARSRMNSRAMAGIDSSSLSRLATL